MKSFKELILFFSVVLISSFGIKAQEVISTQGASYFNALVKWDFTIGETVVFTGNSINNVVTQGFNQPLSIFYLDTDADGYGDSDFFVWASAAPLGYVTNSSDCNDTNIAINPTTVWYLNADGDGYYVWTSVSCTSPGANYNTTGGIAGDCNDTNAAVNAGATETCNGIDDDCDAKIDENSSNTY